MDGLEIPSLDLNIGGPAQGGGGIAQKLMQPVESMFSWLGLDSPFFRFTACAAVAGGLIYFVKPQLCFSQSGHALGWSIWSAGEETTWMPWWLLAILVGAVFAVFV